MAIKGISNGTTIETDTPIEKGQKVIIIPINNSPKQNETKADIVNELFGSIHSDMSLLEIKEERLKKYEITT